MRQDERAPFVQALERAREAAFPPGEYVGQESFMPASEIRVLADRAGIRPGVSVLDLCCGVAGPGRLLARERECTYLGVDSSASAVEIAPTSASLSRNASIVSSRSTTSNVPGGSGGTSATSNRHASSMARSRAISTALALESTPR